MQGSPNDDTHDEVSGAPGTEVPAPNIHSDVHPHSPPVATWPIPRQLPPDVSHFVGRSGDLVQLDTLLTGEKPQPATAVISAVAGTAGVGKTALALHWAHLVRDHFPDGDLFANLHGYDPGPRINPEQILDGFLRAMDVPAAKIPTSLDAQAGLYRSLLTRRRVLVVLDNAASTEDIRPLLPGSPTCMVIITSRSRLSGLVARDGAHRVTLDVLPPDEAIALLREIIGPDRTDGGFAELAAYCCYLPLALRVAAERVTTHSHWSLADLLAELSVERDRLDVLATDDDETSAVRAVFSWSYSALPSATARMFRLLGLHRGTGISTGAAAALADTTATAARRLLDSLAGVHLIEEVERDRYRFHDLLRAYAADRAEAEDPSDERANAVRRMLTWYLHSAEAADKALSPHRERIPLDPPPPSFRPPSFADYDQAWNWCEAERANLVDATRLAAEVEEDRIAWQLPAVLLTYFTHRNPRADWLITHEVGLRASRRTGDRYGEAWLLTSLALVYRELRRFDEALGCLRGALPLWREVGQPWGEGWTLFDMGWLHHERGEFQLASDHLQQALVVRRESGDRWGEGSTLAVLARVHQRLGHLDDAVDHAQQALALQVDIGNRRGEGGATHILGDLHRDLGRLDEGFDYLRQALALRRETSDRRGEADTLRSIGEIHRERGEVAAAREAFLLAAAILDRLEDPRADEVRAMGS